MRILFAIVMAWGVWGWTAAAAQTSAPAFLSGLEDVPLMAGLSEDKDAGFVFDKPEGRIGEAAARGSLDPDDIRSFYNRTLPELGWRPVLLRTEGALETLRFLREGEELTLTIVSQGAGTTVRFSLAPAAAGQ